MKEWIEKYLNGEASEEELKKIRAYFLYNEEELEAYFSESEWDQESFAQVKNKLLQENLMEEIIRKRASLATRLRKLSYIGGAVAACLLVVFFITRYHYKAPSVQAPAGNDPVVYENTGATVKEMVLSDGSRVQLSPDSRILIGADFNQTHRMLQLTGEAVFYVHKNEDCRFIVSAGNVNTTAIGTVFKVTGYPSGKIAVKLLEGKILVEEKNNTSKSYYILPGKTIAYENATRQFSYIEDAATGSPLNVAEGAGKEGSTLSTGTDDDQDIAATPDIVHNNDETIFTDVRLVDVLATLARQYQVKIAYPTGRVSKIRFAGSITQQQDIYKILSDIAIMNQFSLEVDTVARKYTLY